MRLGQTYGLLLLLTAFSGVASTAQQPNVAVPRAADALDAISQTVDALQGALYKQSPRFSCERGGANPRSPQSTDVEILGKPDILGPVADLELVTPYRTGDETTTKRLRIVAAKWNAYWRRVHKYPAFELTQMINDPNYAVSMSKTQESPIYTIVSEYYAHGEPRPETTTWWTFSISTHEPTSVRYAVRDPARGGRSAHETIEYDGHSPINGFSTPTSYRIRHISGNVENVNVKTLKCGAIPRPTK